VALSYRANDLRNLDTREVVFSESFTLPMTAQNVAVLGAPHSLDSLTTTPYRLLPAVLTSPGGVVLLNGFALIESVGVGIDITLTSALGALFAQVGERELRDLDLSAFDHTWDFATVRDRSSSTDGYTYAVADIGYLAPRPLDENVLFWEQPACPYALTVLRRIVTEALPGYQVRGSLLDDAEFKALVLPRATPSPQLRAPLLEQRRVVAAVATDATYTGSANSQSFGQPLSFPVLLTGDPALFTGALYQTPAYTADLKIKLRLRFRITDGSGSFNNLAPLPTVHVVSVNTQGQNYFRTTAMVQNLYTEQELVVEEELPVFESPSAQLQIMVAMRAGLQLVLLAGSQVEFSQGARAYPGGPVHLDASLPDCSQADFLTLLANRFNLVFDSDPITKVVYCNLFNDLERRRNQAVDWTDKLDFSQRPALTFRLGDYAQRNIFRYSDVPDEYKGKGIFLVNAADAATGAGELLVANTTLPAKAEAYEAPVFLPQQHAAIGRGPALWLPFWKLYAEDDLIKLSPVTPMPVPWRSALNIPYIEGGSVLHNGRMWLPELSEGTGGDAGLFVKPGNPPTLNQVDVQTSNGSTKRRVGWKLTDTVLNDELATWALVDRTGAGMLVHDQEPGMASYTNFTGLTSVGLGFTESLAAYHKGTAAILRRVQVLTVPMWLNAMDISGLDYTRPIKLSVAHVPGYGKLKCLCYLNNIEQYIPGSPGPVEVTLLVLGLPVPGLAPPVGLPVPAAARAFATESGLYFLLSEQGYFFLEE
jgi:hypothetical protein